jgi:hypothetical protein
MSSVHIRFPLSSYKCFILEKTLSIYALLHGIENKKQINLCRLSECVGFTDNSIFHKRSDLISFVTIFTSIESSSLSCSSSTILFNEIRIQAAADMFILSFLSIKLVMCILSFTKANIPYFLSGMSITADINIHRLFNFASNQKHLVHTYLNALFRTKILS